MLRPCALFSDGAVLCRGKDLPVFGEATDGQRVTVLLTGASGATLAQARGKARDGRFLVFLPAQQAQTGCELRISTETEETVIRDVAVGEVWLAGGQSNMELALMNSADGPEETAQHDDPLLRFFEVPKYARACPEAEEAFAASRWQPVRPGEAGWVSAVAYWFAKKRRADTGVPVGVIDCWWGGTSITCWMSRESLLETAAGQRYIEEDQRRSAGITMEDYLRAEQGFLSGMSAWNDRVAEARRQLPPDTPWREIEEIAGPCPWNPPAGPGSPYRPAGLYDAMLRRVTPMRLSGVIYYQGEEDAERTDRYELLMARLISLWRSDFRDDALPFLFVQLPGWGGCGDHDAWPRLRWAQEQVFRSVRHTGMAVTIDLGEQENIHPTEKKPVGLRLAEQAGIVADGLPGEESSRIVSAFWQEDSVLLRLSQPVAGALTGFQLRDGHRCWHPAAAAREEDGIRLTLPEAEGITGARYAWLDWPEVTLFGGNGLPLAPWKEEI